MKRQTPSEIPSLPRTAKILGQLSLLSLPVSILIGFTVEQVGINSLFFSLVLPLSLVALLISTKARRSLSGPEDPGYREAKTAQRMALLTLGLTVFFILAIALFFILAFWQK